MGRGRGKRGITGLATCLLAVGMLVGCGSATSPGPNPRGASTSPAAPLTSAVVLSSQAATTSTPASASTTTAVAPTTTTAAPPPVSPPAAVPPPPPAAPLPASSTAVQAACHPLTNSGHCYEPGEYCRNSDHGATGVAGDGKVIKCEDNNGWRWEPV